MNTNTNDTQNRSETANGTTANASTTEPTGSDSRAIADGGATWSDLTGFQRDLLEAIATIEHDGEEPYGLAIKADVERRLQEEVNHGRLYPNLDTLVDYGFVEKGSIDKRTNSYSLTDSARAMLEERTFQLADACGIQVAATDGGEPDAN